IVQATEETDPEEDPEYHDRRILLPSITEQRVIYLLPTEADSVETEFMLDDQTGEFGSESILIVEKPIEDNNETTYRHLAGDEFGSANEITTQLEEGARYQLYLRDEGEERSMGSYSADRERVVDLEVDDLVWELSEQQEGVSFDFEQFEKDDQDYLRFQLSDPDDRVTSIDLE
ncbi:hypothetical protein, partial [Microbispora corallina]|uniref:hypothetical protein n=1 Tax=Microbispora corallina TaxID=83302 RepID=UPI0031DF2BDA